MLYTSGTTGPPKGVVHTHATVLAGLASFEAGTLVRDEVHYVSFLPLAHLGERGLGYWRAMVRGSTTTYCPDPTQLARALVEARPTWIFAAPRIWERLMVAITTDARDEEPAALRERFGLDRLEHAITGAAPCPEHVLEFFRALGIPIVELWGMTEVWIGTLTRPGQDDIGTVGRAQAGFELRLAPDGELLIRGPAVTPGYLNRPDATAELFDADGWLRTGDLATIDAEGRVRIVDRKKEMFISSAGHNMSPANIEAKLKASSPLIAQVCCFGDGRDYNIAVITLEPAAVRRFASRARGDRELGRGAGARARGARGGRGRRREGERADRRARAHRAPRRAPGRMGAGGGADSHDEAAPPEHRRALRRRDRAPLLRVTEDAGHPTLVSG